MEYTYGIVLKNNIYQLPGYTALSPITVLWGAILPSVILLKTIKFLSQKLYEINSFNRYENYILISSMFWDQAFENIFWAPSTGPIDTENKHGFLVQCCILGCSNWNSVTELWSRIFGQKYSVSELSNVSNNLWMIFINYYPYYIISKSRWILMQIAWQLTIVLTQFFLYQINYLFFVTLFQY